MNPVEAFGVGIAPEHAPALVAAAILPVVVWLVRRLRTGDPTVVAGDVDLVRRWAAWLLGMSAAVHLALPLGHYDGPLLTLAFIGSGAAYAWLALRALEGRPWRALAVPLLIATLIAYLIAVTTGFGGEPAEEPDQVGIATALVELASLGLCLVSRRSPGIGRALARSAGSVGVVVITLVTGVVIWVGTLTAHTAAAAPAETLPAKLDGVAGAASVGHAGGHEHAHDHAARAQAGIVMRPPTEDHPTLAETRAAQSLATATAKATARFADLDAALAAGYQLPAHPVGVDVHLENKAFKSDGRVLDPQRPEMLVYAISGGRATLLGVVYVMERAGQAGPEPGGLITRWHAHNLCLTLLPPGFGAVSPFGGCPPLAVAVTIPEMMHVWVVDNPAGPFAEGLDKAWVAAYHSTHGRPVLT